MNHSRPAQAANSTKQPQPARSQRRLPPRAGASGPAGGGAEAARADGGGGCGAPPGGAAGAGGAARAGAPRAGPIIVAAASGSVDSKVIVTFSPIPTRSPDINTRGDTSRSPLMKVPFVEPRSSRTIPPGVRLTRARWGEIYASPTTKHF